MLLFTLLSLMLLQPSAPPDLAARIAKLTAEAEAHHDAKAYAAAASAYLTLASLPHADSETAVNKAHLNLDAAFLETGDVIHLCRALAIAQRRLGAGNFRSDQAQLSWQETAADDTARLAQVGGAARCPSAAFPPKLLAADVPLVSGTTLRTEAAPMPIGPVKSRQLDRAAARRSRARTAAGATLTGMGLGLGGLMGLTLALHVQQLAALRQANDVPESFTYPVQEQKMLTDLRDDAQRTEAASIGLGVASAAVLGAGIGLLASGRRATRAMAVAPHGGPYGGGVRLRLRF